MASKNRSKKYFTVDEANRMLPLVRAIVGDIVRQSQEVQERRERIESVRGGDRHSPGDLYREELEIAEAHLERDEQQLRTYIDELTDLDVEIKGPEGLCDFPAILDGREVYLCWKLGEPEVMYWHDLDAGFKGRQRLTANLAAGSR